MNFRRHSVVIGTGLVGLTLSLAASAALVSAGTPAVKFTAKGTLGMTIHGTSSSLKVSEKAGKVTVSVPLAALTTGIDLRDRHMKNEYLHVSKFGNASLEVERKDLRFPERGKVEGTATGAFTLHGVAKTKKFAYTAAPSAGGIVVNGTMLVNILDHGIKQPQKFGVNVDPNVVVAVTFTVQDS